MAESIGPQCATLEKDYALSPSSAWHQCAKLLEEEYAPTQFNMWLRPLQAEVRENNLILLAPNKFVVDWVKKNFCTRIKELVLQISGGKLSNVSIEVGTKLIHPIS